MGKSISAIQKNNFHLEKKTQYMSYYAKEDKLKYGDTWWGRTSGVLWVTI